MTKTHCKWKWQCLAAAQEELPGEPRQVAQAECAQRVLEGTAEYT